MVDRLQALADLRAYTGAGMGQMNQGLGGMGGMGGMGGGMQGNMMNMGMGMVSACLRCQRSDIP